MAVKVIVTKKSGDKVELREGDNTDFNLDASKSDNPGSNTRVANKFNASIDDLLSGTQVSNTVDLEGGGTRTTSFATVGYISGFEGDALVHIPASEIAGIRVQDI